MIDVAVMRVSVAEVVVEEEISNVGSSTRGK